jgi:anti-sigma factor (TIGR02949 family)
MNSCEEIRDQIAFYLDDELHGDEQIAFVAHLNACAECRTALEYERQFIEAIRAERPLYTAPEDLRSRIEKVLGEAPPVYAAPPHLRQRLLKTLWQKEPEKSLSNWKRFAPVAASLMLVALAISVILINRPYESEPKLPEFALMAVNTHQRRIQNRLPLEISTDSPEAISKWFAGKVPFQLELPRYQESSGQEKLYSLEGARLVGFHDDYAAYVAYQMRSRPISLVVTSSSVAQPSGGEEIASKGLTFHYHMIDGYKVITWSDRGLTYALVSDLEERGQQSCIVCHAGTKDRDFIERLKPNSF